MEHATSPTHPAPPIERFERATLVAFYERMALLRRFELKVQELGRSGKIGFLHLYIGEEATAVGVCAHLTARDWITSTHRGHGHALAKGMAPADLLCEIGGKANGCCGGRGGSMHLYDPPIGLFGTNGLVGGGIPSAVGAALSAKVKGEDGVAVAFFGDGAVNHGSFHESVNFAAAQDAPVVFVCENNLYATATPLGIATRNTDVASKAAAYGLPGVAVDGNDVLAVWDAARIAVERARAGKGPTLIEARTYRTVGHHEGDPVTGVYRTKEEVERWKLRDPLALLRTRLIERGIATEAQLDAVESRVAATVVEAERAFDRAPEADPATVFDHVYASPISPPATPPARETATQGWLEAVRDGIAGEMRRDQRIIYLGEGIGERGGSFAHTKNLWQEFGGTRVVDTPISELGFTGAALGAAATGCRAVADLMFAGFLMDAATQIVNQAAKLRYTSNGRMSAPMIVRAGAGEVRGAGPHHSDCYHPLWAHVPGLIVCLPSTPADAKGLMTAALRAGDPVLMLEHKSLFASKGVVPQGEHVVPFGRANVVREGRDITLVTCGLMVHRCLEAATKLEQQGVSCEIVDLRTIVPLDVDTVVASVARTGRCLVVDEGYAMCGLGGEIAAMLNELAFDELDAPIGRIHTLAATFPTAQILERAMTVGVEQIVAGAQSVIDGRAPSTRRHADPVAPSATAARPPGGAAGPAARTVAGATPPAPTTPRAAEPAAPPGVASTPAAAAPAVAGTPVLMPHGDLTITEGTVKAWLKKPGDAVKAGEPLVEVETEKSIVEVEAPCAGVLAAISASAGTVVKMGGQLGVVAAQAAKAAAAHA